jgi:hypothetical protein
MWGEKEEREKGWEEWTKRWADGMSEGWKPEIPSTYDDSSDWQWPPSRAFIECSVLTWSIRMEACLARVMVAACSRAGNCYFVASMSSWDHGSTGELSKTIDISGQEAVWPGLQSVDQERVGVLRSAESYVMRLEVRH